MKINEMTYVEFKNLCDSAPSDQALIKYYIEYYNCIHENKIPQKIFRRLKNELVPFDAGNIACQNCRSNKLIQELMQDDGLDCEKENCEIHNDFENEVQEHIKWIKCDDSIPKESGSYLVYIRQDSEITIGKWDALNKVFYNHDYCNLDASYWMPLPGKPSEKEA